VFFLPCDSNYDSDCDKHCATMALPATHKDGNIVDDIHPGPPPLVSPQDRRSSKSSGAEPAYDEKKAAPYSQYDVDPENQSDKVGSVRRGGEELSEDERRKMQRRALFNLWAKRVILAAVFLTMTASVPLTHREFWYL